MAEYITTPIPGVKYKTPSGTVLKLTLISKSGKDNLLTFEDEKGEISQVWQSNIESLRLQK